ncbi:CyP450 monooxygenase [Pilatotrama ljubarskyi]|nr:CyP450 monooxygenase [Pilatotrama ljubarskyi]
MSTIASNLAGYALALAFVLLTILYMRSVLSWTARMRGLTLPPGPRRLPVVGNFFNMPKNRPWEGYRDMREKYGDVIYLQVLGQSMLVLNSAEAAIEYLDKRSENTSDRPQNPVVEMSGQDLNLGLMPYGPWWRRHRRTFWQYFHPGVVPKYQTIQQAEAYKFVGNLLGSPTRLKRHIRNTFATTMLKLLYDVDVKDEDDEHIRMMDAAFEAIKLATPGQFAVEIFPFLRHLPAWFPGAGFQTLFASCKAANDYLKHVPFDEVRESLERGQGRVCIAADMLARDKLIAESSHIRMEDDDEDEDEVVKNVCAVAFEGGSDTTFSVLQAVFVAMALHPDVQKRAQAELDAVVGPSRLPDFGDSDQLVYVNALVKEALRWHVVVPLTIPHRTVRDDEFHGYFIPGGTTLMANVWAILHDPEAYNDPDVFRPERFIRDGKLDHTVRDPVSFAFGFGRRKVLRICPGRYFANSSLFITIASILHVFDIGLPLNEKGEAVQIKYEQSHGLLSYPTDCRCTIKPRSARAAALILDAQTRMSAGGPNI